VKKWYFISPLILQKLIWIPTRLIFVFFGHLEVRGLENLKEIKGNVIFACNHTSELDPILPPASLTFFSPFSPIFYTSREKAFYDNSGWRQLFYGGTFFKVWGSYPVYVGLHDYKKSLINHIQILQDGGNLGIFPEGKTTHDGTIQRPKAAWLIWPTLPALLSYQYSISGVFHFSVKNFLLRRCHFSITYGKSMRFPIDSKIEPSSMISRYMPTRLWKKWGNYEDHRFNE